MNNKKRNKNRVVYTAEDFENRGVQPRNYDYERDAYARPPGYDQSQAADYGSMSGDQQGGRIYRSDNNIAGNTANYSEQTQYSSPNYGRDEYARPNGPDHGQAADYGSMSGSQQGGNVYRHSNDNNAGGAVNYSERPQYSSRDEYARPSGPDHSPAADYGSMGASQNSGNVYRHSNDNNAGSAANHSEQTQYSSKDYGRNDYARPGSPDHSPAAEYARPGSPDHSPAAEYARPGSPDHSPAADYARPSSSDHSPAADYARPSSPDHSPAAEYARPSSSDHSPAADYAHPSSPDHSPVADYGSIGASQNSGNVYRHSNDNNAGSAANHSEQTQYSRKDYGRDEYARPSAPDHSQAADYGSMSGSQQGGQVYRHNDNNTAGSAVSYSEQTQYSSKDYSRDENARPSAPDHSQAADYGSMGTSQRGGQVYRHSDNNTAASAADHSEQTQYSSKDYIRDENARPSSPEKGVTEILGSINENQHGGQVYRNSEDNTSGSAANYSEQAQHSNKDYGRDEHAGPGGYDKNSAENYGMSGNQHGGQVYRHSGDNTTDNAANYSDQNQYGNQNYGRGGYARPDNYAQGDPAGYDGKPADEPRKNNYGGDSPNRAPEGRPEKKKKKGLRVVLAILTVLVLLVSVGALLFVNEINGDQNSNVIDEVLEFPEGASTGQVAEILYENGVIRSVTVFKIYCRITGVDGTFQYGKHIFSGSMTYAEVVESLQQPTYVDVETVTFTFPEGTTALKMAIDFENAGFFDRQDFIDACNNDIFDVSFYDMISHDDKFIVLEGFLFPDTYEFEIGSTPHEIIQIMLENFEKKVLTEERRALIESNRYTLEEIIILASIVQKEALGEENYAKVAAVFHNRLDSSSFPYLESCVSADWYRDPSVSNNLWYNLGGYFPYVLEVYYGSYEAIPQNIKNGYDTRSHEGLIVGAISNPGILAIDGAISPESNWDYYFFCTDETGKFYWAMTADEHARNWEEVEKVNKQLKENG